MTPSPEPASRRTPAEWHHKVRTVLQSGRLKNIAFSSADHVWILFLWAASTPVFISTLGKDLFGIWVLINALVGLTGVFSFGFGEATTRFVAKYRAAEEPDTVARVVETTWLLYGGLGLIVGLACGLAAPWFVRDVFDIRPEIAAQTITALRLAGVALLVTGVLKVFESAINGFERFDLTARFSMATRTAIIGAHVCVVLLGGELVPLLVVTVLALSGQTLVNYLALRRRFMPRFQPFRMPSMAVVGQVVRFGAHMWLQITTGNLANVADRFLVGALIGPAAAGVYAVCIQLTQQIMLLIYRALAFLMPAVSHAYESGGADAGHLSRIYRQGLMLLLLIVGSIVVPLYVLAPHVLTVWIGPEFAQDGASITRVLTIYFAFECLTLPPFFLLNGAGRPVWNTGAGSLHSVIIILLAVPLLSAVGILGAAWARVVALPTLLIFLYAVHRIVLRGDAASSATTVSGLVTIVAVGMTASALLSDWIDPTLVNLMIAAPTLGLLGLAVGGGFALLLRRG